MLEVSRWAIALVAVFNFGGLFVDGILPATARTHLYNPNWPPHAKFHNCQTMLGYGGDKAGHRNAGVVLSVAE